MLLFCESNLHGKTQKKLVGLSSQATVEARSVGDDGGVDDDAVSQELNALEVNGEQTKAELGFISLDDSLEEAPAVVKEQPPPPMQPQQISEYDKSIVDFSSNVRREYDLPPGALEQLLERHECEESPECSEEVEDLTEEQVSQDQK